MITLSYLSLKGRFPVTNAYKIHPMAHISKAGDATTFFYLKISGGK
jgi:hypothetical protein